MLGEKPGGCGLLSEGTESEHTGIVQQTPRVLFLTAYIHTELGGLFAFLICQCDQRHTLAWPVATPRGVVDWEDSQILRLQNW